MIRHVPGLVAATLGAMIWAQTLCADVVDDYIQAEMAAGNILGLALLVMRDGRVVKEQGYGEANLELRVPVTPDTIFQSGSIGKQFTAAGILLLAEDGELDLDDPLSKHFPGAPSDWRRITIRQLLAHTSGIKDYSDEFDYRRDYTDEETLAVLQALPLDFEPGTRWSYSNSGYVILGLLTGRLAGQHWSEFQAERLFRPLEMTTTRVISERDLIANRAAGYELDEHGIRVNQAWVAPGFNRMADGALYFTVRDLAAWERALEARAFMQPAGFEAWWTPATLADGTRYPYGFGWFLSEQRGQPVIEHGGSWQGFRAAIARYPRQRLAVVALANISVAQPEAIAHAIAGLVDPALQQRETTSPAVPAEEALERRLYGVLEAWAGERTTPAMSPQLAAGHLDGFWREQRAQAAERLATAQAFEVLGGDTLTPEAVLLLDDGTVRAVDTRLLTPDGAYLYRFRLDADDRVVRIEPRRR